MADGEPLLCSQTVRVTEEELENCIENGKTNVSQGREKSKRYSKSRVDTYNSRSDDVNGDETDWPRQARPNEGKDPARQTKADENGVTETAKKAAKQSFAGSSELKAKENRRGETLNENSQEAMEGSHDEKKEISIPKKERVRRGFQPYQVKKGKYSDKIEGIENIDFKSRPNDDRKTQNFNNKRENVRPRKSNEKYSPDKKTISDSPESRDHRYDQRGRNQSPGVEKRKDSGQRNEHLSEDWDSNDSSTRKMQQPVSKENKRTFGKPQTSPLDKPHERKGFGKPSNQQVPQFSKQKSLEEDWDLPSPTTDKKIHVPPSTITEDNMSKKDKVASQISGPRHKENISYDRSASRNHPSITETVGRKVAKTKPEDVKEVGANENNEKADMDPTVNAAVTADKTEGVAGTKQIDSAGKSADPKEQRKPLRGIGRGKKIQRSDEKKQPRESQQKDVAYENSKDYLQQRRDSKDFKRGNSQGKDKRKNITAQPESNKDTKLPESNPLKKKVQFSEENIDTGNSAAEQSGPENLSKGKTAGIIVLPTPDMLKSEKTNKTENTRKQIVEKNAHKKGAFSKLERPKNFDPNKGREDAKLKSSGSETLTEREDFLIPASADEIWKKIKSENNAMKNLLSRSYSSLEDIDKVLELSVLVQDLFKELIVKHQDFSFKNDVEGALWKNTFHNVITRFRTYMEENSDGPLLNEVFQFYWNFLQDGDDFLQDLLISLQEECKFDMDDFVSNPLKMAGCKKHVKFAVRSCHLILLNLGDLERYITDLQQDNNYSKAIENYHKAQVLAPKNGKSYNQLAVVAVKCKKKLDAIYFYIRSLEASNPIESARERLTGIFQEIKRKADQTKKQSLEKSVGWAAALKTRQISTEEEEDFKSNYSREDIWVFFRSGKYHKMQLGPNGKLRDLTEESDSTLDECDAQDKVSLREANKEFLVYYLYMHSKFYTRIGFEHVMTVYQDSMQAFKLLLKNGRASSMKKVNLIKYMAINVFSIDNLFKKQEYSLEVMKDSAIDVAIIFGMDMSGLIADHCVGLLSSGTEQAAKSLEQFLPAIHTWMKWMCGYLDLIRASSVCYMKDIWDNFVSFFNLIRSFCMETVPECQDGEPVGLFEDGFLSGFQPLIDMEQPSMKVSRDDREKAENFLRMESLKDLTYMISDSNKLPVLFNEDRSSFEVVTPTIMYNSPAKNGNALMLDETARDAEEDDSDVIIEDVVEDVDDRELQYLRELKARKMELTARINDQEKRKQERAAIVETNASQVHMISENHPKYIVPDTNCFIDNLEGIVQIIDSKDFNVILPLIVVNELDGLKKGADHINKYPTAAYAAHVKERARLAIDLLENRFSERDSQLKALTSAGTELDTIAFRDEELTRDKGKNDDVILSCCLHYCDEAVDRYSSTEGPMHIKRSVVLLTDDRNLRLKAHSRHVPTISLQLFLRMAKLL